jgi:hypothetical protein
MPYVIINRPVEVPVYSKEFQGKPADSGMIIRVYLKKREQLKLPKNVNIGIFMSIRWTNSKWDSLINGPSAK